jgi:alpha-D-xyloside xylohydrolase
LLSADPGFAAPGAVSTDSKGVTLETSSGLTRVEIWGDRMARVLHTPTATLPNIASLAVTGSAGNASWQFENDGSYFLLKTSAITVRVESPSGQVSFSDPNGVVLSETASGTALTGTTVGTGTNAVGTYIVKQSFAIASGEAIYGLGQQQEGVMNRVGTSVTLQQKNMYVGIPVLLSNKGYCLFWDNPAVTTIDAGKTTSGKLTWSSEAGDAVNYFFCYGPEPDQAIAGYRQLTGAAPMFGKWAWGFWQCKERYQSQAELLAVSGSYRQLGIPIDGIIQDWQYWPTLNQTTAAGGWGSHEFDPSRYPDPVGMTGTLHAQHIHTLISVWAKFDVTNSGTSIHNLQALEAVGAAFNPAIPYVYPAGQGKWLDPFNAAGRQVYWNLISQKLFAKGLDGWWLDASEAEFSGNWGEFRNFNTALGPGAKVYNAYPLMETSAVYQGQRAQTSSQRAIILTRSAYAGQQRNAAITWSGDINGSWSVFANQIPGGLNFVSSGLPYWNTDIGGFGSGNPATAAYAELFTRWFQYGAFCPMFRVHGTNYAKEVWRFPTATQAVLVNYINLRYRLMPYIYSTAWKVTNEGYTMMRPLVMDFRADPAVNNISNQFMFGPSLMANPVTSAGVSTRNVYLPAGTKWIDFWTGLSTTGSQTLSASAPIDTMPLYVKAGSILPYGPSIQYATQSVDPMEIRVYPGANGSFTLYEDEGDNYNYESGSYATIPFTWDDSAKKLTIGARQGSFTGMLAQRTFKIVFVSPVNGAGAADSTPDYTMTYSGTAQSVIQPPLPALPAAPTGLSGSGSNAQVSLVWNASPGNVIYRVQRASRSGAPYTSITTLSGTSYTDSSVAGGIYYYVLSAINGGGEGPVSAEVSVNSGTAPLQALLMFNETSGTTVGDASGQGNNATLVNGPTRVAGKGGNAIQLDGTSQYASLPSGVVSSLTTASFAAWVNLSSTPQWSRVFDLGTGTTSYLFLTAKAGGSNAVRFAITTSGGTGEQVINGSAPLPTGGWVHVAVTLNGSTGILYVNGSEVGRNSGMTLNPSSLGSTTQNWIGRSQFSDPYLPGLVDDFRIYNGTLSASEVAALYAGTASALRSPWASQDIGSLGAVGSSGSPAGTDIAVTASGADIQGSSDNFHYAWRTWTGDGTLTARVRGELASDPWTKAGIMFRNTLDANSANAYLAITPGNGSSFQYRSSAGGSTSWSAIAGPTAPYWIRLRRAGNVFTPYQASDGVNWVQAGNAATLANISGTAYLGFAVTSHTNGILTAVQFDNIAITDSSLPTPAGLSGTGGYAQVSLAWQPASGVTGYNLKRSDVSGGPYTKVASAVSGTSFTDSGLAIGGTYYYVISSVNSDRESLDSAEISASTYNTVQSWRYLHFGTIANSGAAADSADPDGDGMSNAQEFAAGTDPNDASSVFKIGTIQAAAGGTTITFPSALGKTYQVEYSDDLSSGSWTALLANPLAGTGAPLQATDPASGSKTKRFYRVAVY